MSESARTITRHRLAIRAVLGGLGLVQVVNGLWALIAPRSFYGEFPLGRGWVEALPDYSEHLMRDVGALFIATAAVLLAAGWWLDRRLVAIAAGSFLLFSAPHAIYHLFNLEPYGTGDAFANVLTLAATVLLPAWVLFELARERRSRAPIARAAEPADGRARIAGVPDSTRNPLVRFAYRESRRRFGAVMDPMRIHAHAPALMAGYSAFELATERTQRVDQRLKLLAEMRAGMICGCEWCLDFGSALCADAGLDEEDLRELALYRDSDRFGELDKLVLDYASAISRSPVEVSDELFARLREHFDEPELVELTNVIALENYRARFNWAFGIGEQGFSEGSFCVAPEARKRAPGEAPSPTLSG